MGRRLGSAVPALAALGVVCALCVAHASDVSAAIAAVPAWAVVATVAVHVVTLVLRSEAWRLTLAAASGSPLPRRVVHRTNAAAFVAGAVQSQAALPARVAVLRRLAGDRAPRAGQIFVADVPIFALELCAAGLLVAAGVVAGFGDWWMAPAALALGLAVLLGARHTTERFAHRPIVRGLAVLADRRRRGMLLALVAAIAALTAGRVWLVLVVCGLPHGLGEVAWVFATLGAFGLLPLGPSAPAGATLAALGTASVGAAVAAGLLLSVSSIAAVVVYSLACVRPRTPARPAPCQLGWAMLHTLPDGTRVRLRFVEPADKRLLAAGMAALSPRSRRQRFLAPKSHLTADALRYLSEVDGHDHVAIVAVLERNPSVLVGAARFVRDSERPDEAEAAITVGDPWRGAGMGRRLGEALADAARRRGVRRFTATLLGSNAAAHALFASISRRVTTQHSAGIADLAAELQTGEHRTAA